MARKSSQGRLTIPKDIWDSVKFNDYLYSKFGFFKSNDSRIIITNMIIADYFEYEFLGSCKFDDKHRFFIPKNVDEYLGEGDIYYFTSCPFQSFVYIYKINNDIIKKRQSLQLDILLSMI